MSVPSFPVPLRVRAVVVLAGAAALGFGSAQAGHEISYYPSFYPQEIRIEPLDPQRAAEEFDSKTDPLHVYLGAAPRFAGNAPDHIRSVQSLGSLIVVSVNSKSQHAATREARCRLVGEAAALLAERDGVVAHPRPVTPYHADYLHHSAFSEDARPARIATAASAFDFRLGERSAPFVVRQPLARAERRRDIENCRLICYAAGVGFNAWAAPPRSRKVGPQAHQRCGPPSAPMRQARRPALRSPRMTNQRCGGADRSRTRPRGGADRQLRTRDHRLSAAQ